MNDVFPAIVSHLRITFLGVSAAVITGLPTAALLIRREKLRKVLFVIIDAVQTVPTLAMLTFVMLILGLNDTTVIAAIFLYSLFPIIRNTYVGLTSVDEDIVRAGRGIGMTNPQVFSMIRFPIAWPLILNGIRLALISALSLTTTGVFIGAGGLGMLIWRGIQTRNISMMLSGAIPVSLLSVFFENIITIIERCISCKK